MAYRNTRTILIDVNCDADGAHCGNCKMRRDSDRCHAFDKRLSWTWSEREQRVMAARLPLCLTAEQVAAQLTTAATKGR